MKSSKYSAAAHASEFHAHYRDADLLLDIGQSQATALRACCAACRTPCRRTTPPQRPTICSRSRAGIERGPSWPAASGKRRSGFRSPSIWSSARGRSRRARGAAARCCEELEELIAVQTQTCRALAREGCKYKTV